jgi:nitroreductase
MHSLKEAQTEIAVLEQVKKRWSPRAFSEKEIEPHILVKMFEAARWSASSRNEQPWRFILGRKGHGQSYEKILSTLDEGNRNWCKNAPVLILLIARKNFTFKDIPNNHAIYDCGQAAAYLSVQAINEGIYLHQMAGFRPEKARQLFQVPENFIPITAIAAGYLGDPAILTEDHRQSETKARTRHNLKTLVFDEKWDQSADIFE